MFLRAAEVTRRVNEKRGCQICAFQVLMSLPSNQTEPTQTVEALLSFGHDFYRPPGLKSSLLKFLFVFHILKFMILL